MLLLLASPCTAALRDAVRAVPGVEGASCASPYALNLADNRDNVTIDGRQLQLATASVDFGFFEVYGVHPLAGRLFDEKRPSDDGATHADDAPPIVINESAVRSLGFASPQAALGHWVDWHFIAADYAGLKGDPEPPAPAGRDRRRRARLHLWLGPQADRADPLLRRREDRPVLVGRPQRQARGGLADDGHRRHRPDLEGDRPGPAAAAGLRQPVHAAALHRHHRRRAPSSRSAR